jgi:hypothetical protein
MASPTRGSAPWTPDGVPPVSLALRGGSLLYYSGAGAALGGIAGGGRGAAIGALAAGAIGAVGGAATTPQPPPPGYGYQPGYPPAPPGSYPPPLGYPPPPRRRHLRNVSITGSVRPDDSSPHRRATAASTGSTRSAKIVSISSTQPAS